MFTVVVYLQAGITYEFSARSSTHGREIANRIIREGLWVKDPKGEPEGTELFFPTHLIAKVKLVRAPEKDEPKCTGILKAEHLKASCLMEPKEYNKTSFTKSDLSKPELPKVDFSPPNWPAIHGGCD